MFSLQETAPPNRPACKSCACAMGLVRLDAQRKQPSSELRVFVCSDCGLYQLVRPKMFSKTAA